MYYAEAYSEPCQSSKTEGSYQSSKAEVFFAKTANGFHDLRCLLWFPHEYCLIFAFLELVLILRWFYASFWLFSRRVFLSGANLDCIIYIVWYNVLKNEIVILRAPWNKKHSTFRSSSPVKYFYIAGSSLWGLILVITMENHLLHHLTCLLPIQGVSSVM